MSKEVDARANRAAALREAQQREERKRRLMIAGAVGAVLAVVLGVGFWIQSSRDTTGDTAFSTPDGVAGDYSVLVGDEAAPTTITVYEDLQCPVCQAFEEATAERLAQAVESGDVQVEYRLVSFLDDASTNDDSSRALNALLAVLDTSGTDTFQAFHDFLRQPTRRGRAGARRRAADRVRRRGRRRLGGHQCADQGQDLRAMDH